MPRSLLRLRHPHRIRYSLTPPLGPQRNNWNAWFDALIYVTDINKVVLQLLLRRVLLESQIMSMTDVDLETDTAVTEETVKAALIFISIGPIVILYPFAQKYFIRGVLIGSVKG